MIAVSTLQQICMNYYATYESNKKIKLICNMIAVSTLQHGTSTKYAKIMPRMYQIKKSNKSTCTPGCTARKAGG